MKPKRRSGGDDLERVTSKLSRKMPDLRAQIAKKRIEATLDNEAQHGAVKTIMKDGKLCP